MIDDDDPKSPVPAPEGAPAGDKAAETQEELPLEGDEPEGDEAADTEPTDDEGDGDDEQDDEEDDDDEEGVPKRKSSRVIRYKREAEAAKARLAEMRSRVSTTNIPQDDQAAQRAFELRVWQEVGDPPDPNDPKYANNYVRFERETQAWENDRRAVTREVRKEFLAHRENANSEMAERVSEHKARIARLRTRVKDFDQIMARATLPVYPHVERLILHSKKSDQVSLHLAKDQAKLARLNRMSPEDAAREIGIIEGRIIAAAKPKAKATQARKPVTPLRGGGASPTSGLAAVNAYMKKQGYRD
jgi:hypothetical protein